MKSKLTLSVEADAISRMKQYARRRKVSLSRLFTEWSEESARNDGATVEEISPGTSLRGRWKPSKDNSIPGDARLDYLLKKHAGR